MSKNRDYKLLDTLFPTIGLASFASSAGSTSPSSVCTKRTFKISDDLWTDFIDLVAIKKVTQAELINELIKNAIDVNRDLIEQYRAFFREHKK